MSPCITFKINTQTKPKTHTKHMQKIGDIVATVGKYTDNQGNEKKRYLKCGSAFQDDQGRISMKMDGMPVGQEWSGWLSVYPNDSDRGQQSQQPQHQQPAPRQQQNVVRDEFGDPVRSPMPGQNEPF